jgi:hypothetical protein
MQRNAGVGLFTKPSFLETPKMPAANKYQDTDTKDQHEKQLILFKVFHAPYPAFHALVTVI